MSDEKQLRVSWDAKEDKEYNEYTGTVVRSEFGTPWTVEKSPYPDRGPRIRLEFEVSDPAGGENRFMWVPPVERAGTRWAIFREAMKKVGAWKDLNIQGNTDEERLQALCNNIIGMTFVVHDYNNYPGWGGKPMKIGIIAEYRGKTQLSPKSSVATDRIALE